MKGIADTGFIVAFGNRLDSYHAWAVEIAKGIKEPLLTCEAVLAEAVFHLGSADYVFSLVRDDEMVRVAFDFARNLDSLQDLAVRYQDQKPDLADLCLIRMIELHPKHVVITVDAADFRTYRRNKREVIPYLDTANLLRISHLHLNYRIKFLSPMLPLPCLRAGQTICSRSQHIGVQWFKGKCSAFTTWHNPCIMQNWAAKVHGPGTIKTVFPGCTERKEPSNI